MINIMGFLNNFVVELAIPRTRGMVAQATGKSGQLKGRVARETWPFVGRPTRRDRATETIKGETFHR